MSHSDQDTFGESISDSSTKVIGLFDFCTEENSFVESEVDEDKAEDNNEMEDDNEMEDNSDDNDVVGRGGGNISLSSPLA